MLFYSSRSPAGIAKSLQSDSYMLRSTLEDMHTSKSMEKLQNKDEIEQEKVHSTSRPEKTLQ